MQKQQHSSRRRALWMAAACLALAGLLAGCGGGPRTSEDGAFRYELEDGGKAVITGCEAAGAAVSIPAVVDGRLVSAVAAGERPREGIRIRPRHTAAAARIMGRTGGRFRFFLDLGRTRLG